MNYTQFYHLFEFLYNYKLLGHVVTSIDLFIISQLHTIIKKSTFDKKLIKKLILMF